MALGEGFSGLQALEDDFVLNEMLGGHEMEREVVDLGLHRDAFCENIRQRDRCASLAWLVLGKGRG